MKKARRKKPAPDISVFSISGAGLIDFLLYRTTWRMSGSGLIRDIPLAVLTQNDWTDGQGAGDKMQAQKN